MPIYEYECRECKERFEVLQLGKNDQEKIRCPKCQADKLERVVSLFSSGSGNQSLNPSCSPTGST